LLFRRLDQHPHDGTVRPYKTEVAGFESCTAPRSLAISPRAEPPAHSLLRMSASATDVSVDTLVGAAAPEGVSTESGQLQCSPAVVPCAATTREATLEPSVWRGSGACRPRRSRLRQAPMGGQQWEPVSPRSVLPELSGVNWSGRRDRDHEPRCPTTRDRSEQARTREARRGR
jgi:hypothetical protein